MSYYIFFFQILYLPERTLKAQNFAIIRKIYKNIGDHISDKDIQNYFNSFNRPRGLSGINYYRASLRGLLNPKSILKSQEFKKVHCEKSVVNDIIRSNKG